MAETSVAIPISSTTIDDIANWAVVGKMRRVDILDDAREAAKDVYLGICGKVPFDSLRHTSTELPLAANDSSYDISTITQSGGVPVAGICSIRLTYASGRFRRLRRSHSRVYDALGSITYSIPSTYARWGGMLEFNPGAGSAMTFRMRYWGVPVMDSNVGETILLTPPNWDELLKWETYYRMLIHTDQFEKAQSLVNPMPMPRQSASKKTIMFETAIIPRLWNDLLLTIDQREGVDEDFSMNPVVRRYTNTR